MTRFARCLSVVSVVALASACRSGVSSSSASRQDPRPRATVAWRSPIELARGAAYAGPWRMNDSEFRYVDDPTLALRQDGQLFVAWVDNTKKDIFFQALDSAGKPKLAAPVDVSRSPETFSWLPRLVVAGEHVFALWQEIIFSGGSHGGEIAFSRSLDGGRTFDDVKNLSRSTGGDGKGRLTREHWDNGSLDLARTEDGTLLAAWTEYDGPLWLSRSTDGGQTFSAPLKVAGSPDRPARAPALAIGRDGAVLVAWTLGEDPAADIWLAVSTDRGQTFSSARAVARTDGHSDAPKIAVDDQGRVHAVWTESKEGPFGASRVRYARSAGANAAFEASTDLSAPAVHGSSARYPSISVTRGGKIYVAWHHYPRGNEAPRGLGFVSSRDGGGTFSAPSLAAGGADSALGANGSRQGKLMRLIAANDAGSVAIVNSRFREGHHSRIELFIGQSRSETEALR